VGAVRRIHDRVVGLDGAPWPLRAGVHVGRPIEHRGDVFGADVNLAARLCSVAAPDELVRSVERATTGHELVEVRGLPDPVPVVRVALA
jgi:class 3 adenylate cyclase